MGLRPRTVDLRWGHRRPRALTCHGLGRLLGASTRRRPVRMRLVQARLVMEVGLLRGRPLRRCLPRWIPPRFWRHSPNRVRRPRSRWSRSSRSRLRMYRSSRSSSNGSSLSSRVRRGRRPSQRYHLTQPTLHLPRRRWDRRCRRRHRLPRRHRGSLWSVRSRQRCLCIPLVMELK